jgi:hypothetical protein
LFVVILCLFCHYVCRFWDKNHFFEVENCCRKNKKLVSSRMCFYVTCEKASRMTSFITEISSLDVRGAAAALALSGKCPPFLFVVFREISIPEN